MLQLGVSTLFSFSIPSVIAVIHVEFCSVVPLISIFRCRAASHAHGLVINRTSPGNEFRVFCLHVICVTIKRVLEGTVCAGSRQAVHK